MLDITDAIDLITKTFPDKDVIGAAEYDGKYVFGLAPKGREDDYVNWNSIADAVDINTGELSTIEIFGDFLTKGKPIEIKEPMIN